MLQLERTVKVSTFKSMKYPKSNKKINYRKGLNHMLIITNECNEHTSSHVEAKLFGKTIIDKRKHVILQCMAMTDITTAHLLYSILR